MEEFVLSVKDISVSYGKTPVVFDVSFDVGKGHVFGLMGLNGAGKTTLIKTILGLREGNKGSVFLFGKEAVFADSRKAVAYLPERFTPPWFLTGMEFVKFSVGLYGTKISEDEIRQDSEKLALAPDVLKRRVHTYSKGMKQKLGILATLLSGSSLLILDEPMSGLDPLARVCVKDAVAAAVKNGSSVFLSSHILADMDEMCDVVGLLHEGRMVFNGAPSALKKEAGTENIEQAFLQKIGQQGKKQAVA